MTVHKQMVETPITDIGFESGFNGASLDADHTLIWCSDHAMAEPA